MIGAAGRFAERITEGFSRLWDDALATPREVVVLRLTLLLLLFYGPTQPLELLTRLLAFPMLLTRKLLLNRWLWTGLALACLASTLSHWFTQDNHKFLIFYWTFACCLAVWSRDPDRALHWNARLLIPLVFTFAVLWKFLGGQVVSGEFFEYSFLLDSRFEALASMTGGLDASVIEHNRNLRTFLKAFPAEGLTVDLSGNPSIRLAAAVTGWMMVVLEAVLALSFWRSFRRPESELHDWILLAFCLGTYTLTPVVGFGFVLAVMGYAQCGLEKRDARQAYLWMILLVQLAALPTMAILARLVQ